MYKICIIREINVLFCLLFFGSRTNAQDGPYVFYRNKIIITKTIQDGRVKTDTISPVEKLTHPLAIHFTGHPDWDFTVNLKPAIIDEPGVFPEANKVIAFSDIEGEFEPFRKMLVKNKVIDEQYNWLFGQGVLVIAGDLFDRGKDVNAFLWVLYKLESEAKEKGGYVHVILGNHDIMNLSGDFRYVEPVYLTHARQMGMQYKNLYAGNTELGRWLRSKNILEKVGDLLFLHGGVSREVNDVRMSIDDVNSQCRPYYDLAGMPEKIPDKISIFFEGSTSPFWYRGYFYEPKADLSQVDNTLKLYDCSHIIVGHSIMDSISILYNGKVIGIDVNEHEGNAQGLLIEDRKYYKIDASGEKKLLF
jgi:DNA repair exonuclease SbcCD nuclease subunit